MVNAQKHEFEGKLTGNQVQTRGLKWLRIPSRKAERERSVPLDRRNPMDLPKGNFASSRLRLGRPAWGRLEFTPVPEASKR